MISEWPILEALCTMPKSAIFYVGANEGQYVAALSKFTRGGHLYAFEPDARALKKLVEKYGKWKNATIVPLAVADEVGKRAFCRNLFSGTSSLYPWNPQSRAYNVAQFQTVDTVEVETITLDQFCQVERITEIELLYIDVQGGEYAVLCGASELLGRRTVKNIFIEVFFSHLYQGAPQFLDVWWLLNGHGYNFWGFFGFCQDQSNGIWHWGNALFTRGT